MGYKRTVKHLAGDVPPAGGRRAMSAWWWVAMGFVASCDLALAAGLLLGPVRRSAAQARKARDAQISETPHEPTGRPG